MAKFIKYGRVVILLHGRHAGKKAVVVKASDDGTKDRKFGHALVAGISKYPRKVTKLMGSKKIKKRTKVTPFIKHVNLNHLLPTRYQISGELDLKSIITDEALESRDKKQETKKKLKLYLQDKYVSLPEAKGPNDKTSHVKFLFKKLRF
eukprot:CAMPEP_0176431682 /NCGR_PEP_ID=MMETSP0127-20121128/14946_1 /TAXON_ID=938130 /ORGANISM="Platyophrya macrostoma, Strain WH" /LENGTH=148 /DNA_ID=CAMNT_0017813713 /DNA_START=32 /DNA_END=478 /DNA_ORIENTATION=+